MAGQERISGSKQEHEEEVPAPEPTPVAPVASASTVGVDDLLDEIDGVLERNAEDFVRGFVQKGGQ